MKHKSCFRKNICTYTYISLCKLYIYNQGTVLRPIFHLFISTNKHSSTLVVTCSTAVNDLSLFVYYLIDAGT